MSDYEHIVTALSSIGATHPHYFGVCNNAIDAIKSLQRTNEELVSATQLVLDERNDNKVIANLLARLSGALYDRTCPLCREKLEQELRAEDEFQDLETRLREQIAENERLRAAAITPEMRETAEKWLKDYAPGHTVDYIAMALSGRVIIHDLLGKQG